MGRNTNGSCGLGSCCCLLILTGIGGSLAWYFTRGGGQVPQSLNDVLDFIPSLSDFQKEEPFQGESPDEVPRWENTGEGIELEIINALQDQWHSYFDEAVNDWNNGSPDLLTLTTSVAGYDPDCLPLDGVMKVCNNDYGDTGWYGVNEILAVGKIIVSSVAKMNDYYFPAGTEMPDRRLYTLCHEVGHGFGFLMSTRISTMPTRGPAWTIQVGRKTIYAPTRSTGSF